MHNGLGARRLTRRWRVCPEQAMDILYLLIPLSAVLVLGIVAVFGWAVTSGQFDDVEREGQELLAADRTDALDGGQGACEDEGKQFASNDPDGGSAAVGPGRGPRAGP